MCTFVHKKYLHSLPAVAEVSTDQSVLHIHVYFIKSFFVFTKKNYLSTCVHMSFFVFADVATLGSSRHRGLVPGVQPSAQPPPLRPKRCSTSTLLASLLLHPLPPPFNALGHSNQAKGISPDVLGLMGSLFRRLIDQIGFLKCGDPGHLRPVCGALSYLTQTMIWTKGGVVSTQKMDFEGGGGV